MMGLNKLGAAVTVVVAVTLAALAAETLYLLWRRRRRYRPRGRVEPQEPSLPTSSPPSSSILQTNLDLQHQVMKYQCHYGPSRMLFTIKEEEREGFDLEKGECSAVVVKKAKTVSFGEVMVVNEVAVKVADEEDLSDLVMETTPFSTPCGSPPYYTPHSSPGHEGNG